MKDLTWASRVRVWHNNVSMKASLADMVIIMCELRRKRILILNFCLKSSMDFLDDMFAHAFSAESINYGPWPKSDACFGI